MTVTLHHGDCLQILPTLPGVDAVVSDPPYGINHDTDYTRFSGGVATSRDFGGNIEGDASEFDPSPWLDFPKVILFGANCFSDRLPTGSLLVWCKKPQNKLGKFMGDCEVAWQNSGHGVYLFHHVWDGFNRESERGETLHPTQKPVALMKWCIERLNLPAGSTILDPYMGSGSTGVAAVELGYHFVGIETNATYFGDAGRRIRAAERQPRMAFLDVRPARRIPQPSLFDAEVCDGGGP